jgi:RNA polymerase-binding protein DksA
MIEDLKTKTVFDGQVFPGEEIQHRLFLGEQRELLLKMRAQFMEVIKGVAEGGAIMAEAASGNGMHLADAGSDSYERDFSMGIVSRENESLREVDDALKRMEVGTYGVCEACGKKIGQDRLKALPFTRYTVDCQERLESKNINFGKRLPMEAYFTSENPDSDEGEEAISSTP